jgi:hypothetical protein
LTKSVAIVDDLIHRDLYTQLASPEISRIEDASSL